MPRKSSKPKSGSSSNQTSPQRTRSTAATDGLSDDAKLREPVSFPVVAIGASAGGLEAFIQLLRALPHDTGMAFVFVQHLHPDYHSALADILSRETRMRVREVEEDTRVVPNQVFVIPPNAEMVILNGRLHLLPRESYQKTLPIDQFFRSLAQEQGAGSIGVVLSGTASDGTLGLKAIKAEGGITFVQDEKTAKYGGMPHNAIAAGVADFVLPPDRIGKELARIAQHPYTHEHARRAPDAPPAIEREDLNKIFVLLRLQTSHDFTHYKSSTIERRMRRRMVLNKLERVQDYVRYLQSNPKEVTELFNEILINVTGFFRDPDAFNALAEKVFPRLTQRTPNTHIRIWTPGCSTGEEAYSIAMALQEFMAERGENFPIQIFATDIDEVAIETARAGLYPDAIAQDVAPERLKRFFVKVEGGGYLISKTIRDMCVFAIQNAVKDPPFSKLDLISCRNLLIYLAPVLQKKLLSIFHYALKPDGVLFLGTAETVGGMADLFRPLDPKERLYEKKVVAPLHLEVSIPTGVPPEPKPSQGAVRRLPVEGGLEQLADRLLMNKYAPPGVVVDEQMNILHFRGRTGDFLEPAPGEASFKLMKMAREGLASDLNSAIREAIRNRLPVRRSGIRVRHDDESKTVDIEVSPIVNDTLSEAYFLVVFKEQPEPAAIPSNQNRKNAVTTKKGNDVLKLEEELSATREYLQSVIEQQETTNEELRSANEEIQSSNEELQSINEELETAKEELQSTNEELATVNEELHNRAQELERANNDLVNLVDSINIPIVIVGRNLRVRRFTPPSEKLLNLIASDVGRPISDIKPNVECPELMDLIKQVIDEIQPKHCDAQDRLGRWYSIRVYPYKTLDNRIDGAVVAFIDVNEIKASLEAARQAHLYTEAIIAAVRQPLLVLDKDQRVVSASKSYYDVFQVTEKETVGNLVYRLGNGQWAIPQLRDKLDRAVAHGEEFTDFPVTHRFEKIGVRTMNVNGRQIPSGFAEPMVLMQIEDRTDSN